MSVYPDQTETIAAISTAPGEGAIGILRISGSMARPLLEKIFRLPSGQTAEKITSHRMLYGRIVTPDGTTLDEVMAIYMQAPKTYTREDVVEIQCHGSLAALQAINHLVLDNGARPAEPGEFTLRAFLNGRIDLTRAEAVMDVIRSRTERSLLQAESQLSGRLGNRIGELREELIRLLAHVEAYIDFPEEDLPDKEAAAFDHRAGKLRISVEQLLGTYEQGRIFREGSSVAIVGRPNVGKSSLLNLLLAQERAIVTDQPGTTRDTVEETISVGGIPVRLIDTAGIREGRDHAESEGIRRSREAIRQADLVLLVLDRSLPMAKSDSELLDLLEKHDTIIVMNKADLPLAEDPARDRLLSSRVEISAKTGAGLPALQSAIQARILKKPASTETVMITRSRHRDALEQAGAGLGRFRSDLAEGSPLEFLALSLRESLDSLDRILGRTTPDDVLGVIFSDFCIGK